MTDLFDARGPCVVHPHAGRGALPGYMVCEPCIREGRDALDDIVRLAAILDDPEALLPQRGSDTARGGSSYRSASPARDGVIALRDWRSIATRRGEPDDVLGVLVHWGDRVRADTGLPRWPVFRCATARRLRPRTVAAEVRVLGMMWSWVCRRAWAGWCLWEISNIAGALREVAQENRGRAKLGRCPVRLDGLRCNVLLLVRPDAEQVTCPRCDTRWPRLAWLQLATDIEQADIWDRREAR